MARVWYSKATNHYFPAASSDSRQLQSIALKSSYIFLELLDLVLTLFAAHLGIPELNPLMRTLLASPLQLVVIKLVIPLLIAWLVPGKFLIPAIVFLSVVIGWNMKELLLLLL